MKIKGGEVAGLFLYKIPSLFNKNGIYLDQILLILLELETRIQIIIFETPLVWYETCVYFVPIEIVNLDVNCKSSV